jgi:Na+-translocating ferredoxin:NAD+ oxidoreductase RnfG subunit
MLALTIFAVVAVALTAALQQTVDASILLRDEAQVRLEIQNLLAETNSAKLKPGKTEIQTGDGRVRYEREIRPVEAKTARGEVLSDLYEIVIRASWQSSGRNRSDTASLIVYQP